MGEDKQSLIEIASNASTKATSAWNDGHNLTRISHHFVRKMVESDE